MTVINPNSVAGINSITVQSGEALSVHKSDGTLIQTIVSSTGISTFSSVSVGSATTTNNADKSINIGLGASISQHAVNSLSFGTRGDERARIDSSGRLIVGHTASTGEARSVQVVGTNADTSGVQLIRHSADSAGAKLDLTKSRNATKGSNTIVQDDDGLGDIAFRADDGTDLNTEAARISAAIDGTPGANDIPGRLMFLTTADGENTPTERLRITSTGDINVSTAATIKANGNATFSGIVTATSFVGDGSGLTGAGPTLANGSDNRVVTATGANAINGEASLVYTGSRFGVNISGGTITDIPATSHDTMVVGHSSMTSGGICLEGSSSSGNLGFQMFKGGSFLAARML